MIAWAVAIIGLGMLAFIAWGIYCLGRAMEGYE